MVHREKGNIENLVPSSPWIRRYSPQILDNRLISNRSLFLDKYGDWQFRDGALAYKDDARKSRNLGKSLEIILPLNKDSYSFLRQRRRHAQPGALYVSLRTKTRLIINLGVESVFETSIALHRLWGFPIIPGSAVKGVFRHYCVDSPDVLRSDELIKICGNNPGESEAVGGKVVFLDAWPTDYDSANNALEMDIMTPHYQHYYQNPENTLPTDDNQPIPIQFLAVKKDVPFEFIIAPSSSCTTDEESVLLDKTIRLLTDALREYGIGAKTGSSYGYFEVR